MVWLLYIICTYVYSNVSHMSHIYIYIYTSCKTRKQWKTYTQAGAGSNPLVFCYGPSYSLNTKLTSQQVERWFRKEHIHPTGFGCTYHLSSKQCSGACNRLREWSAASESLPPPLDGPASCVRFDKLARNRPSYTETNHSCDVSLWSSTVQKNNDHHDQKKKPTLRTSVKLPASIMRSKSSPPEQSSITR